MSPSNPNQPAKAPTIDTVARRAGVSIATVSRVMNGVTTKVSPETVARVRSVVDALGYRPSGAGSALRRRRSRIGAALVPNAANAYMAAVAASLEDALRAEKLVMILCDTREDRHLQDDYLLEMRAHSVAGIVMFGAVDSPVLDAFLAAGETIVFVNRRSPGAPGAGFVGVDNGRAGADVAEYLVARDLVPAGLIHADTASSATADRVAGFLARLSALGRPLGPEAIGTGATRDHIRLGFDQAKRLLGRPGGRPRAVSGFRARDRAPAAVRLGWPRRTRPAGVRGDPVAARVDFIRDGLLGGPPGLVLTN